MPNTFRLLFALPDGFGDKGIFAEALRFFKDEGAIPASDFKLIHDGSTLVRDAFPEAEEQYGHANQTQLELDVMRLGTIYRHHVMTQGQMLMAASPEDEWRRLGTFRSDVVLAVGRSRKVEAIVAAARAAGKPVHHYLPKQVMPETSPLSRNLKRVLIITDTGVSPEEVGKAYALLSDYYGLFDAVLHDLPVTLAGHVPDLSIRLAVNTAPSSRPTRLIFGRDKLGELSRVLDDISVDWTLASISGPASGAVQLIEGGREAAWIRMLTLVPYRLVVCIGSSDKVHFCAERAAAAHVPVVMLPKKEVGDGAQ